MEDIKKATYWIAIALGGVVAFLVERLVTHRKNLDFTLIWITVVVLLLAIIIALIGLSISTSIKLKECDRKLLKAESTSEANIKDNQTLRRQYNLQNDKLQLLIPLLTKQQIEKYGAILSNQSNQSERNDE